MNHEHIKKIRIYIFSIAFLILVGAIYYVSYSISTTSSKLAQCRELFDNKDLENKKKICCDETHYNASDELCSAKCDTIGVNPNSSYCTETALKQGQPGVTKQITKPKSVTRVPECQSIGIDLNAEKSGDSFVLKAGKPLKLSYQIYAPEIKAKAYIYEFFSYEEGKNNFQAISFEPGKTYKGYYNASDTSKINQVNDVVAFHEDLYKPDLNMNSEYPKNVLMTLSIIDSQNSRSLQRWNCFVKIKLDQTPNYCKNIEVSDKEISKGESVRVTVTPNTVNVNNYDFRIINLDNDKEEVSFENPISSNAVGQNNSRILLKGNKGNPTSLTLNWTQLYKKDKNTGNNLKNVRIKAFVRPLENVTSDDVASCSIDFKVLPDEGVKTCDGMKLTLVRVGKDSMGSNVSKDSDGIYTMKSTDYMVIESKSKLSNVSKFIYTFHNLENLIDKDYGKGKGYTKEGIKNAYAINFRKNVDLEITKAGSGKDNDKRITIDYADFNSIDLLTGKRPKKVQVRSYFVDNNNQISGIDSKCVQEFRIE